MNNIPYKEALELKELGFDEKTDVWRQHGEGISGDVEGRKDYWNRKGVVYTAMPTYSQAFRWFRDKYGLAAVLDYFHVCKWTYKIFEFTNTKMTPNWHQGDYSKERTYEEAEHDCLVELIRFAKKEQNEQRHIAGNLDNSIEEADLEVDANKVVKHIITNTDYRLWKVERKMDLILNHLGISAEDLLVFNTPNEENT